MGLNLLEVKAAEVCEIGLYLMVVRVGRCTIAMVNVWVCVAYSRSHSVGSEFDDSQHNFCLADLGLVRHLLCHMSSHVNALKSCTINKPYESNQNALFPCTRHATQCEPPLGR